MNLGLHAHTRDGARERYSDGENCAQSVIAALDGTPGLPPLSPSLGAGFTTGIGHKGCVCGALVGGVAVLSEYAASQGLEPAATRQLAEELAASLHTRFEEQFGATCCRVIKRGQAPGSDEWLSHCATITEESARTAAQLIAEHQTEGARHGWAVRDIMSAARRVALDGLAGSGVALLVAGAVPQGSRGVVVAAATVALVALGLALELRGPSARRAGRYVRAAGGLSAGLLALVAALAPRTAASLVAIALADTGSSMVVRAVVALCAVIVAATSAFSIKRYR